MTDWQEVKVDGIPRRNRTDLQTIAEGKIREAMYEVEASGGSTHLTKAINLLSQALDAMADHHEGKPDDANEAAQQPPAAPPQAQAPEKDTFQIIYGKYDDANTVYREGVPNKDPNALTDVAVELLRKYDVREVFLVTVHAAFGKEILIKKTL